MEGVGISLASLVFSFLEFGLLASQLIFFKKYRKVEGFTAFTLLTILFIALNLSLVLVSIDSISSETALSFKVFNATSIALYLFFLNISSFLSGKKFLGRIPWFFIAISLAFGVQIISETIQMHRGDIETLTQVVIPIVLVLTTTLLVFQRSRNSTLSLHGFWVMFLLFITFIFGSFIVYFKNFGFVSYLYINIIFLLFASIQFWSTMKKTKEVSAPIEPKSLDDYGFTTAEREIVELILKGYSYQEIASKRFRTYGSITAHAHNIFSKVGNVHSQEDLIRKLSKHIEDQ